MRPHERPIRYRDSSLKYLEDIALVEELAPDGTRLFPHTGQLPMISKAVNKEFFEALPRHYAITDHRGDDRRKYVLHKLSGGFCEIVNACRGDDLLLLPVWRRDMVCRVAIVQRHDRATPNGTQHGFRLFVEGAFFPAIHLSGKRILYATHVFDRFRERCAKNQKVPLAILLSLLHEAPGLVMRVNHRESALVIRYPNESMLALPFQEFEDHFVFLTCLTVNEIHDLRPAEPFRHLHFHYGNTLPEKIMSYVEAAPVATTIMERWRLKTQPYELDDVLALVRRRSWTWCARALLAEAEQNSAQGLRLGFSANFHTCDCCLGASDSDPIPPLDPPPEAKPSAS